MLKEEFKKNVHWVLRTKRDLRAPGTKVKLVEYVKRGRTAKVKITHADGELVGLEEFVRPGDLDCRWAQWKRVQSDERREVELRDYLVDRKVPNNVTCDAATEVLQATGEDVYISPRFGYTFVDEPEALDRIAARAKLEELPWGRRPCFKRRNGDSPQRRIRQAFSSHETSGPSPQYEWLGTSLRPGRDRTMEEDGRGATIHPGRVRRTNSGT